MLKKPLSNKLFSVPRRTFTKISAATLATSALQPYQCFLHNIAHAAETLPEGFYMPEESLPHQRTFMQWPVSSLVHPDHYFLADLQQTIADIANNIATFEPVVMLMDKQYHIDARRMLSNDVTLWDIPTEDLWCRDSGPLFLRNDAGDLAISSLNFNGWGNKQVHKHDSKIAQTIAEELDIPFYNNGLVGEAGGVESNGAGMLLAHKSSWVNPNRNGQSIQEISQLLLQSYGAKKIIWADGLIGQDITDYHIDSLARFVDDNTILIQLPEYNPEDPFTVAAFDTEAILRQAKNLQGAAFDIVTIKEPRKIRSRQEDFVASYVNYYVCNGAVICAEFGDETADKAAYKLLKTLYPEREIVMLNIDPIAEVGGGIHCATCQQPIAN